MSVVLYRVDERLIHGQVVVGWGSRLEPALVVVVDDELARSPWEQELYTLGLPEGVRAEFHDVAAARKRLPSWRADQERVLVLTRDLATMRRFAEEGTLRSEEVNIGGIHHAEGRTRVLPYVFLGARERADIQGLLDAGVDVSARDLPGSRRVDARELLAAD